MTQPKFAPISRSDEVREAYALAPPRAWISHRPADFHAGDPRPRRAAGIPGPDQGYALHLARLITPRIVCSKEEHLEDVLAGTVAIALRRASLFGRAPVLGDLEVALGLFGFFDAAPDDLVTYRRHVLSGLSHDYYAQRNLASSIPDATLRKSVNELQRETNWKARVGAA